MKRMFFRKSDREKLIRFIGVVVIALLCLGGTAIAATVVVTPGSMDGWTFYKTDGDPTYTYGAGDAVTGMVNGPGTPPLGTGSAHFNTGSDGSQSAQLRNDSWAGTSLSSLTSLGYSTYATSWNGQPPVRVGNPAAFQASMPPARCLS